MLTKQNSFTLRLALLVLSLSVFSNAIGASTPAPQQPATWLRPVISFPKTPDSWRDRVWLTNEVLIWQIKATPVAVPLLSTFAPGSISATTGFGGQLGVSGTRVLSPASMNYNKLPGDRLTVGMWLDEAKLLGVAVNGFFLSTGTAKSETFANSKGSPSLRALFVNTPPGAGFPLGPSSFVLAAPDFATGGQALQAWSYFWGAEANGIYRFWSNQESKLSLLGGLRYLNLNEKMQITDIETELMTPGFGTYTANDYFKTRNQIYSGQIGIMADTRYQRVFASIQGKLALGVNHETVTLNGNSTIRGPIPSTESAGLYVQYSNTGTHTKNAFAVVPEVMLLLGIDVTSHLSLFLGYDLIYANNVVRPGDQIDPTLNLTQSKNIDPPGVLAGAARPEPLFKTSSFWAQGVNLGLGLKW